MVYLILAFFVLGMNVAPALMPPTWVILAFFYTHFHLGLFPTVLIGATSATLGRIALYFLTKRYFKPVLPHGFNKNYSGLGEFIKKHQKYTIPVVVAYAFLPIPSNNIFIIAGLANLDIKIIALSFFFGRLISYTFWVVLAYQISTRLSYLFASHLTNWTGILIELMSILLVVLIGQIDWQRALRSDFLAKFLQRKP